MRDREKKMLFITLAVVITGFGVDRVYAPLRDRWEQAHESRYQLEQVVERDEILALRTEDRVAERDRALAALPLENDPSLAPALLAVLQDAAGRSGLDIQSTGRPAKRDISLAGLAEVYVPIELRDVPYSRLVNFLRYLREADGLIKVSGFRFQADKGGKLSVSLRVSALVRIAVTGTRAKEVDHV